MSKFYTTSSELFNKDINANVPEWMQPFVDNIQNDNRKKLDIEFDRKGSFEDATSVTRPDFNATPREMIAGLNKDKLTMDAKIELSKFLKGKYYKTTTTINGNTIYLKTNIDSVQAEFIFPYKFINGKTSNNDTFIINDCEYPFSNAGFEESLSDLNNGILKKSQTKIASSSNTFVINREEIIRRFNGQLRDATDAIDKNLKEGIITGVGSNSYASYYDPNTLFPQLEKEIPQLPTSSFDFVNNSEHVATHEYKSAKKLSIEASTLIGNLFANYIVNNTIRDNNELLLDTEVFNQSTGMRHKVSFNFKISNEKLASLQYAETANERLSIDQLLLKLNMKNNLVNQYLKSSVASKYIKSGMIFTERELKNKLFNVVGNNNISNIITAWQNAKLLSSINSTTYSSKYTFEELLNNIECEGLTEEQANKINEYKKVFGSGMDLSRVEQKDTGIRESNDIELSTELKFAKINNQLSKHFKNYQIISSNNDIVQIRFSNNGVRHLVKLQPVFNGRKLETINAIVNDKMINIDNLSNAFKNSNVLKAYLQDNKINNFSTNIIASERNILERLSKLVSNPNEVLTQWKQTHLQEIGDGIYSSDHTFEELLNVTVANALSDNDKHEILLAQQFFGTALERIATKNTGIRDLESRINNETLLYEANKYLSQHFANYSINNFIQKNNDICFSNINIFDESLGLSTDIDFVLGYVDGKIKQCKVVINKQTVGIENIKKAFAMNETLNKYLKVNSGKKFNVPMVITKHDLLRKLSAITNANNMEINEVIDLWQKHGKVYQLNDNTYASKLSLEQLISMSNIKPLSDDEIIDKLDRCKRDRGMSLVSNYINDNDTRRPDDVWSLEKIVLHARSAINNMFADFDIIDAESENNNYIITARIINPVNGLKQSLKFNFITSNGTKLGDITSVSDGNKTVSCNKILDLLGSNNNAVNQFVKLNGATNKRYKNIISKNNLKSKLLTLIDMNKLTSVVDNLVTASIITPIDNFNYASEYSFSELVQYLSNKNCLDLKTASDNLKTYNKDNIVDTNIKHVKETDTRILEKKEEVLSPDLIKTCEKLSKTIVIANNAKKITNNKRDILLQNLKIATNGNDIECIWRELKRYL